MRCRKVVSAASRSAAACCAGRLCSSCPTGIRDIFTRQFAVLFLLFALPNFRRRSLGCSPLPVVTRPSVFERVTYHQSIRVSAVFTARGRRTALEMDRKVAPSVDSLALRRSSSCDRRRNSFCASVFHAAIRRRGMPRIRCLSRRSRLRLAAYFPASAHRLSRKADVRDGNSRRAQAAWPEGYFRVACIVGSRRGDWSRYARAGSHHRDHSHATIRSVVFGRRRLLVAFAADNGDHTGH